MSFVNSLDISASALSAQRLRMDIISQNIANQETYNTSPGGDPYCRQLVIFSEKKKFGDILDKYARLAYNDDEDVKNYSRGVYYLDHQDRYKSAGVTVAEVIEDDAPFVPVYDPDNPLADEDGYIYKSNVDNTKEQIDLLAAQRSYEANAAAFAAVKSMLSTAMTLKGR
ncbi:MAG: flagellar basal body rod protein FlgC [Oscillospiraceae bacterium]|nr:flagellar basal body rod protein FlgC [Oscillospiraceae bacterium]